VQARGGINCQLHFPRIGYHATAPPLGALTTDLAPLREGSFHGEFPDVVLSHEQAGRSGWLAMSGRIDPRPFGRILVAAGKRPGPISSPIQNSAAFARWEIAVDVSLWMWVTQGWRLGSSRMGPGRQI
jgi:hypothetical protein